jgi:hypothetical protein
MRGKDLGGRDSTVWSSSRVLGGRDSTVWSSSRVLGGRDSTVWSSSRDLGGRDSTVWSSSRVPCNINYNINSSVPVGPTQPLMQWVHGLPAEVKGRVELYICFRSGSSWPVLGWTLTLFFVSFIFVLKRLKTHKEQNYSNCDATNRIINALDVRIWWRRPESLNINAWRTLLEEVNALHNQGIACLLLCSSWAVERNVPIIADNYPLRTLTALHRLWFPLLITVPAPTLNVLGTERVLLSDIINCWDYIASMVDKWKKE